MMRSSFVVAAAVVLLAASVTASSPPTIAASWSGTCNTTSDLPFVGTQTMVGPCYFDGVGKRTRQDGKMSTPFGSVTGTNVHWWAQTYSQCEAIQGSSDCSYFAPSHIHSVNYNIAQNPFGGGESCTFTYKENVASPACTSDCQQYPNMQIPPFATKGSETINGIECDSWTWSLTSAAGDAHWTVYVQSSDPTTLVGWITETTVMGQQIKIHVIVSGFDPTAPDASVFDPPGLTGCKLQNSDAVTAAIKEAPSAVVDATPAIPTLPVSWSGNCNTTIQTPVGPHNVNGACYYDGVGKRTRQDGKVSTPFGEISSTNVHWWAETFAQCEQLQGSSDCSYFDPTHIHSVNYAISASPFGGGDTCSFTYKENVKSVACTTDCQQYPSMQIPPFATYSAETVNGIPCQAWTFSISNAAGKTTWTMYVKASDPTVIVRWVMTANAGGFGIKTLVDVTDFDDAQPADSVFTLAGLQGCKLQRPQSDDDTSTVVAKRNLRG